MSHLIERYANARLPTFGLGVELSMPRARLLLAVAAGVARETSTRMSDPGMSEVGAADVAVVSPRDSASVELSRSVTRVRRDGSWLTTPA